MLHEEFLTTFDDWNSQLDRGIQKLDHINSLFDNLKNIGDLTKGVFGFTAKEMDKLYDT
jgi:hypothetical protein